MNEDVSVAVYKAIKDERARQDVKWGLQTHDPTYWLAILVEEVGEVSKAYLEHSENGPLALELVQVAAVCVAWLTQIEREVQR